MNAAAVPTMSTLEFDEASHTYRVDGVELPSVTTVLCDVGVIDYSHIPGPARAAALLRGRMVHVATHYDDEGDLDETTVDPAIMPFVEAYRRFRADSGFRPELVERRGYNQTYRYAGTLDRTGWIGSARVLVDIKTNCAERWVALQLAAYAAMFDQPRTYQRVCVELHDDTTYALVFPELLQTRHWFEQFNEFLHCLGAYHARKKYGRKE